MQWGKSLWHVQQSPLLLNFCWNGARQCWIPIHENWKWNAHKGFSFRDGQDELAHKPVSVDLETNPRKPAHPRRHLVGGCSSVKENYGNVLTISEQHKLECPKPCPTTSSKFRILEPPLSWTSTELEPELEPVRNRRTRTPLSWAFQAFSIFPGHPCTHAAAHVTQFVSDWASRLRLLNFSHDMRRRSVAWMKRQRSLSQSQRRRRRTKQAMRRARERDCVSQPAGQPAFLPIKYRYYFCRLSGQRQVLCCSSRCYNLYLTRVG